MWLHEKIRVRTNRKYITGDLQNVSSEVFPIRSFFSSIWMLFCHVLSEYVRICQNGSFLSCIYLHLPQIFAFDLPEKLSESLAPGSRLSEGVIFKGCVVSGCFWDSSRCCLWLLMLFYCVSYRLIVLCISYRLVSWCWRMYFVWF